MTANIITDIAEASAALRDAVRRARRAVVLTGAGVSTESGIPDFRSPGGVWSRMRPIEFNDFVRSEEARLEDWRRRFDMAARFATAEPNAAHRAIARLARDGPVALVATQNIDGLHARAGTPAQKLVELHGTGAHATCLGCGLRHAMDWAERTVAATGASPRCSACGGLVKAAVVSFGQAMPEADLARAQAAAAEADLFVAAGSSLVVYPAARLPVIAARAGAVVVIANAQPTDHDSIAALVLRTTLAATFAPLESEEIV